MLHLNYRYTLLFNTLTSRRYKISRLTGNIPFSRTPSAQCTHRNRERNRRSIKIAVEIISRLHHCRNSFRRIATRAYGMSAWQPLSSNLRLPATGNLGSIGKEEKTLRKPVIGSYARRL